MKKKMAKEMDSLRMIQEESKIIILKSYINYVYYRDSKTSETVGTKQ